MTISVYTLGPDCGQCTATLKQFDRHGVEVVEKRLADHPHVVESAKAEGITTAPVVLVEESGQRRAVWGGFRPDLIKSLATQVS